MKNQYLTLALLLILFSLVFSSCNAPALVLTPELDKSTQEIITPESNQTSIPPAQSSLQATPTLIPSDGFTPSAEDISVEPEKNTLILMTGFGRILKNGATEWVATATGQWLETGDEIQLTEDSNALIRLMDGSILRFSGLTDFKLINAEKNIDTGSVSVIGHMIKGRVMVQVVPLPTQDSVFQMYFFTTIIDVSYEESAAKAYQNQSVTPDEISTFFAGEPGDMEDTFTLIQGIAKVYNINKVDGNYYAVEYSSSADSASEIIFQVLPDEAIEGEIESLLPEVGKLISTYHITGSVEKNNTSGLNVFITGNLPSGEQVFGLSLTGSPQPPKITTIPYPRWKPAKIAQYRITKPNLTYINWGNIKVYDNQCYPEYGLYCKYPPGCTSTGEGCTLPTGCNLITLKGCKKVTYYCAPLSYAGAKAKPCSPTFPKYAMKCDPNKPGACDTFYQPALFQQFQETAENCCVCNPPNTKHLSGWVYFHAEFCDAPNARPKGSCGPNTCK